MLLKKNGTYLSKNSKDPKLCEFNKINADTLQCTQLTYKNISNTPDSNGFVKCNLGDDCYYTTGYYKNGENDTYVDKCQCGYNSQGQGYCPLPQSYRK